MDGDIVQVSPGLIVYRASALGNCSRALLAARLEYDPLPPPPEAAGWFARGHSAEAQAINIMRKEGIIVWGEQASVELEVASGIKVVGHIDGVRAVEETRAGFPPSRLFDVKSQTQQAWDTFERQRLDAPLFRDHYRWQLSVYHHAVTPTLPFDLIRALVDDDGKVVKLDVMEIPRDWFYSVDRIKDRVLAIEAMAEDGVVTSTCDKTDYPCPYFYLPNHGGDDRLTLDDPRVDELAKEYLQVKRVEKIVKGRVDTLRGGLLDALGESKKVTTTSGINVTRFTIPGRDSVDVAQLKEDGLYDKYVKKGRSSTGLRVTEKKGGQGDEDGE